MAAEERLIDSFSAFDEAVQECLERARHSLAVLDFDLGALRLERHDRIERLATFLTDPTTNLRILLHRSAHVEAACPRLLALTSRFAPRCTIRLLAQEHQANEACFVVADATHLAARFNHQLARGKFASDNPVVARDYLERFEALWEKAHAGPSGTPLGL